MLSEDLANMLRLLEEEFGGEWVTFNGEYLVYYGEHADDDPTLRVYPSFHVEWELGWYEQAGDAESVEGVVSLIRAMNAASEALNAVLTAEESH